MAKLFNYLMTFYSYHILLCTMIAQTRLLWKILHSGNKKAVSHLILYYDYAISDAAVKHARDDTAFFRGWNCVAECALWNFDILLQE